MLNEIIFYFYSMTLMRTRLAVRVDVLEVEGGGQVACVPYLHTTRVVDLDTITIVDPSLGFGSEYHKDWGSTIRVADPDTIRVADLPSQVRIRIHPCSADDPDLLFRIYLNV